MTDLGDTAFRCGAGTGLSRTMKFFTLHRSPGVTRACWFSIARRINHAGIGPLALRGRRRGFALGVPGCAGVGARPTGSARAALSACRVAGDSQSWRPRPVCAGTPGAPHGRPPLRSRCLPDWVFGSDGRAKRRFGPCCRGWTPQTWIAGSGRCSRQWPTGKTMPMYRPGCVSTVCSGQDEAITGPGPIECRHARCSLRSSAVERQMQVDHVLRCTSR